MICPRCGAEYVPGVTVCYDCGVDLVEEAPETGPEPAPTGSHGGPQQAPPFGAHGAFTLVAVFVTSDSGLVAIAETMLRSAGIPVAIEGAVHQAHWGPGALGLHQPAGRIAVCVAPQDADDAREILAELLRDS